MPLIGDFADFPLPEVLMLIGSRSGRLSIFDVPLFGNLDIDFCDGEAQAMHVGRETLIEVDHIVANLSAVVQVKKCQFEFNNQPITPVRRDRSLSINQLVILLVCYVDEQVAQQKAIDASRHKGELASQEAIYRKSADFDRAVRAAQELRRITDHLPIPQSEEKDN